MGWLMYVDDRTTFCVALQFSYNSLIDPCPHMPCSGAHSKSFNIIYVLPISSVTHSG